MSECDFLQLIKCSSNTTNVSRHCSPTQPLFLSMLPLVKICRWHLTSQIKINDVYQASKVDGEIYGRRHDGFWRYKCRFEPHQFGRGRKSCRECPDIVAWVCYGVCQTLALPNLNLTMCSTSSWFLLFLFLLSKRISRLLLPPQQLHRIRADVPLYC
jgi:hypothetical protein